MVNRSALWKFAIFGVLIFATGLVAVNFISYSRRHSHNEVKRETKRSNVVRKGLQISKVSDAKPEKDTADSSVKTYKIALNDEEKKNILVREAGQGNSPVLLLHGSKFTSQTWEKIGTLQNLSQWGYRAFAIDIPTIENKPLSKIDEKTAVQWLTKLIETLQLSDVVIVSPSLSGRLSLPYMFQPNQQLARAFVFIAPVGTDRYQTADYQRIQTPALLVHGETDNRFREAFEKLKQLPKNTAVVIDKASHSCYNDNPTKFHQELRQFLQNLKTTKSAKSSKTKSAVDDDD